MYKITFNQKDKVADEFIKETVAIEKKKRNTMTAKEVHKSSQNSFMSSLLGGFWGSSAEPVPPKRINSARKISLE